MEIDLGSKKINIRSWKGRDKKAFLKALKDEDVQENVVMNALVYNCIEEDVILSIPEFKYVLSRIRAISLGEELEIEFYCTECSTIHKQKFLLKDIIKYSYTNLKELKYQNIIIELGEIKNKEIYIQKIAQDPLYDLLLRVESFNGNNTFTLEELEEKFDDLDLNILTEIITQFDDAKFTVLDENYVTCPECKDKVLFEFDELPNFFPESWFEEE